MENILGRYRNTTILVAVLFAQIVGLAVQVKRPTEAGSTRLLRVWAINAVTPIEKAAVGTSRWVRGLWSNYVYLRGLRQENQGLRDQIERMRIEQVRLKEDATQAQRLQALLAFKEQYVSQTVAAQVIGSSGSENSRVVYIDKGERDGIQPDMAVITPDGIVGKVLRVFHSSSQVLQVSDQSSGVGAILEGSRLQGILQGTASGELTLRYIMADEKVQPGERVLSSGGDRIFPKGYPIGTVAHVGPGPDLFLTIRVKPAASLSRLEEVLVVTKVAETAPQVAPGDGPVRAADILAQRLPTLKKPEPEPEKKEAGAKPSPSASATAPTVPPARPAPKPQLEGGPAKPPAAASPSAAPPPQGR